MLDWQLLKSLVYMQHLTEMRFRAAPNQSNVTIASEQNTDWMLFITQSWVSSLGIF